MEIEWEGVFEKYARTVVYKNAWRVVRTHTEEDALQEAAALFVFLQQKYEGRLDGPNHLMGLFKTSLRRLLDDLATKETRVSSREILATDMPLYWEDASDEEVSPLDLVCIESNNIGLPSSHLGLLLRQAPIEVKQVFNLLATIPHEMVKTIETAWKAKRRTPFSNVHLCRLLGYDSKEKDLIGACREYLLKQE